MYLCFRRLLLSAITQFRVERQAAFKKDLEDYFKLISEHKIYNQKDENNETPRPPQRSIALDFNIVGTFGTRVLFSKYNSQDFRDIFFCSIIFVCPVLKQQQANRNKKFFNCYMIVW